MYLPLSLLICLSVVQLSVGQQPVEEEIIVPKTVNRLGGWAPLNPNSHDVQEAAEFAVTMFNTNSKSNKMFKLLSISNAKTKVTNVINYKITTILGRTNCLKSENHDLKSCSLEQRQLKCLVEVTFDPRDNTHELLSHNCSKQRI